MIIGGIYKGEHLSQYYYRRWKEAEAKYYSKSEFFDSCYQVTELMELEITKWLNEEKRGYYHWLDELRSTKEDVYLGECKTRDEAIDHCLEQIKYYSNKNMVACNTLKLVGTKYGQPQDVSYNQLLLFREKLKEARAMDEPQKSDTHLRLKKILESDQAQELYKKLINGDFIPRDTPVENFCYWFGVSDKPSGVTPLVWNPSKALLAYFVDVANDHYKLKHGEKRIIKPFELMFDQKGLTGAINDYKKTGDLPVGHEGIKALF